MSKIQVSIIIPAYNEAKRLANTLSNIKNYLTDRKLSAEIIVVDDGSSDDTSKIAKNNNVQIITYLPNRGKGFAVKTGALNAVGEYVLFSDADLSTPIEELDKFLKLIKSTDIIIGSRALPNSKVLIHQSIFRENLGRIFNVLVNILVLKGIKDTQCGFKLFRRNAVEKIFKNQKITGFCFDVEILYLAKKYNLSIAEVPVVWRNSRATKLNSLKDSIKMLYDMFRIRLYDFLGYYSESQ